MHPRRAPQQDTPTSGQRTPSMASAVGQRTPPMASAVGQRTPPPASKPGQRRSQTATVPSAQRTLPVVLAVEQRTPPAACHCGSLQGKRHVLVHVAFAHEFHSMDVLYLPGDEEASHVIRVTNHTGRQCRRCARLRGGRYLRSGELGLWRSVTLPSVQRCVESSACPRLPAIVSEVLEYPVTTLAKLLDAVRLRHPRVRDFEQPTPECAIWRLLAELLQALAWAARAGVTFGGLAPERVLVFADGRSKIENGLVYLNMPVSATDVTPPSGGGDAAATEAAELGDATGQRREDSSAAKSAAKAAAAAVLQSVPHDLPFDAYSPIVWTWTLGGLASLAARPWTRPVIPDREKMDALCLPSKGKLGQPLPQGYSPTLQRFVCRCLEQGHFRFDVRRKRPPKLSGSGGGLAESPTEIVPVADTLRSLYRAADREHNRSRLVAQVYHGSLLEYVVLLDRT